MLNTRFILGTLLAVQIKKKSEKTGTLEKFSKKSEKNRFFDKFLSLEKTLDHQYLTQLVWGNKLRTSEGNLI